MDAPSEADPISAEGQHTIHFSGEFAILSTLGKNLYSEEVTGLKLEALRPEPMEVEYVEWFQKSTQGEETKLTETDGLEFEWKAPGQGIYEIYAVVHSLETAKTSDPLLITVASGIRDGRKPAFIMVPNDTVVLQEDRLNLEVQADGNPSPRYQWFKDGESLANAFSSLNIRNFNREDEGLYKVIASNSEGSTESRLIRLRMAEPLVISAQPDGRTVPSGQSTRFNVEVSGGEAPLSYEWRKNGEKIGANKSYTIDNPKEAHEGNYRVLIKDSLGQKVLSEVAALTVNTPYQVEECNNLGASRNKPNFNDGYVKFWSPNDRTAKKICQARGYKIMKSYSQNIPDQKGWAPYRNLRIYSWEGEWKILCQHGANCFTKKTPFIIQLKCCNKVDKVK